MKVRWTKTFTMKYGARRSFNGKKYHRHAFSRKKSVIKKKAKSWRKKGYGARVVPGHGATRGDKGWHLYLSTARLKRR